MNKYGIWQLIIVLAMIAMIIVPKFSGYWGIIGGIIMLSLGGGFYVFQKRGEELKISAILKNWLEDERISNLLKQSQFSDFVIEYGDSLILNLKSNHVKLLKEYLGNIKTSRYIVRRTLYLHYSNKINKNSELDYEKFKHNVENQSINSDATN